MENIFLKFIILLVLFFPQIGEAQNNRSSEVINKLSDEGIRTQFKITGHVRGCKAISLNENGVALVYLSSIDDKVYIKKYDKDLNKLFSLSVDIGVNMKLHIVKEYKSFLYILVSDSLLGYYRHTKKCTFIKVDLSTKKVIKIDDTKEKMREIRDLVFSPFGAVVIASENHKIYFSIFNFQNKSFEEKKFETKKSAEYLACIVDEDFKKVTFLVKINDQKKANTLYNYEYNLTENTIFELSTFNPISLPDGEDLYMCSLYSKNGLKVIYGTFGPNKNMSSQSAKDQEGFFLSKLSGDKLITMQKIYFKDIPNLNTNESLKEMNPDPQHPDYDANYKYFIFNDLIENENEFIFSCNFYVDKVVTNTMHETFENKTTTYKNKDLYTTKIGFFPMKFIVCSFSKKAEQPWYKIKDLGTQLIINNDLPLAL